MLVVDEAHHLAWSPDEVSPEYALVEALTRKSHGVLLLTATPEQLGAEGHFARLRLLDPDRYPDLEQFKQEQMDYSGVAEIADKLSQGVVLTDAEFRYLDEVFAEYNADELRARMDDPKALLHELVDRHGTGRVIFRNTRDALKGFPVRAAKPIPWHHAKDWQRRTCKRVCSKNSTSTRLSPTSPNASILSMVHGSSGWLSCCVTWG